MANNVLTQVGATPLTYKDSGGSAALTFSSLPTVAARVGARLDLGAIVAASQRTRFVRWSLDAQWIATPAINVGLEVFAAAWDDDVTPALDLGFVGATDAALTAGANAAKRFNLKYLGAVRVESAAVGPFRSGDVFEWPYRYISILVYNNAAVALAAVGAYQPVLTLTPYYDLVQ